MKECRKHLKGMHVPTVIMSLLLLLFPVTLAAQEDETMQIKGKIKFLNEQGEQIESPDVLWYEVKDKKIANEAYQKLMEAKTLPEQTGEREVKFAEIREEYGIKAKARRGTFKKNAMATMALLFVDEEDFEVKLIPLEKGKLQYDFEWKLKKIKNVEVEGKAQFQEINMVSTDDADDGNERFGIKLELKPGTAREDSRMIVQVYAVDCQSEDTLDYVASMVYEGQDYHSKQIKRMAFDYDKNDKLAKYYHARTTLKEDKIFRLDTIVIWPKPADMKQRNFRGAYTYSFEDYNHVYRQESKDGSCLRGRPFKMLDFTAALHDIPLTTEFYEVAEANFQKKNTKINLRFETGTSKLVNDSLNAAEQAKFVKEMSSYGKDLVNLTIEGGASPDGSLKRNEELARERANVAAGMLRGRVSINPRVTHRTHTWAEVVEALRGQQKDVQAAQIEEMLQGGGDDVSVFSRIKALPYYDFDIVPILNSQRAMNCRYMYQTRRPMEPEECVAAYYKYKKEYIENTKRFSNGDYYNLYDMITDSLELDTITQMAYREISSEPDYQYENVLSPYVCNRMAVRQMRLGTPNVEILRPFIDFKRRGAIGGGKGIDCDQWVSGRGNIKFNRMEIVANQAACYYMEQKVDTALFLIEWLKECKKNDEGTEQLEHLINLKKLHFKSRNAQEEADYQKAKNAVLLMSDENKAILYTEIEDWNMRPQAPMWVDKMDDNNPKKWYLKGILAAKYANENRPLIVPSASYGDADEAKSDTTFYKWSDEKVADYQWSEDPKKVAAYEEYNKKLLQYQKDHDGQNPPMEPVRAEQPKKQTQVPPVDVNRFKGIPEYLAYFQHSFDLDDTKTYYRYYKAEKHVDEDLRKKFPYKKANIERYRDMFKLLKARDAELANLPVVEEPAEGETPADGDDAKSDNKNEETPKNE